MPLLPSTIRSASFSSATARIADAASPLGPCTSISTPPPLATSVARSSTASTLKCGVIAHSAASAGGRLPPTCAGAGSYALTTCSVAPVSCASSTARVSAMSAVSVPLVPTTMDLNMPSPPIRARP